MAKARVQKRHAGELKSPDGAEQKPRSRMRRVLGRVFVGSLLLFTAFSLFTLADAWEGIGMRPTGARLARMALSPQWDFDDGAFINPAEVKTDWLDSLASMLDKSEYSVPHSAIELSSLSREAFAEAPPSGFRVTWLGHSTLLIEIGGKRFLTDPVWGNRTSPVTWAGPARFYEPLIALEDLPPIDAVLISHDHYDHLDHETVTWFVEETEVRFVAPLGVGAHLEYWGLEPSRLDEVDWWEEVEFGAVRVTCTPSRHASGRQLLDRDRTLWAGYAIRGPEHNVFFSGDTGLFDEMRDIGTRLGPFDLTMVEVGAYGPGWPDWHLGPEQAVLAHEWLQGQVLLPVHWGLFDLASHGWTEPMERTLAAAEDAGATLATPRPGQSFELTEVPREAWWPEVPWQTADEVPIVARGVTR